jgi:hypothetical protein
MLRAAMIGRSVMSAKTVHRVPSVAIANRAASIAMTVANGMNVPPVNATNSPTLARPG